MRNWLAVGSLALATSLPGATGCGGSGNGGPEILEGFEVPPPATGQVQIFTPIVTDIASGADVTLCHYVEFDVDRDYDITDYEGFQSTYGHHVILYSVENHRAPGSHECTEEDMLAARYLAGGGAESGRPEIPQGIVLRLRRGSQLMLQTHWINTSDVAISGQGAFNVTMSESTPDAMVADLFTVVSTQIDVAPMSTGAARADCVVQRDMSFFALGGHEHWRGTHVTITHTPVGGQPAIIYDEEWDPHYEADPPRLQYTREEPFVVRSGDRFTVDCQYFNESAQPVRFPLEMCVMWAFYYPADREIDCVDGIWPQE